MQTSQSCKPQDPVPSFPEDWMSEKALHTHLARVPKLHRSTNRASPLPSHNPPSTSDLEDVPTQSTAFTLSEADIDRFATLFSPATPPATPTSTEQAPIVLPTVRSRKSTQGSSDSEFGAFVSVLPSQDPLISSFSSAEPHACTTLQAHPNHYASLHYFDQFTANAKVASERNRREVLDELLHHQDDPMYFLDNPSTPPLAPPTPPPPTSMSASTLSAVLIPVSTPQSTDDALTEALASEIINPKLIRVERGGSVKVTPSPSRARIPLPPRLSGSASPPSASSPTSSVTSLLTSSPPLLASSTTYTSASASATGARSASPPPSSSHPAHVKLSRLSSSFISLLPSGRQRSTAPSTFIPAPSSSSAPSTLGRFSSPSLSGALTHGSPFASTPYIPPTGAPGFAGERAWDRGFSEALVEEEKRGQIDPVGLGISISTGVDHHCHTHHSTTHGHEHGRHGHGKSKGVTLVGRREGTVKVLDEDLANLIRPHLPALIKLPRHWTLLYSLDQHGISLNTLYSRCEPRIASRAHPNVPQGGLLVIRDAQDAVFGAWLSEGIKLEKGGYYGSGDAFLWQYHAPAGLEVYGWKGANAYVALCEPGFISFGGGDGHYGLYLDASLLDGSSAPCPTFGNPPLCSSTVMPASNGVLTKTKDVSFECVGLEVWGVGTG